MSRERRSLRNYIIEPKFQHRYLVLLLGSALVPVIFTIVVVSYFLNENYSLLTSLVTLDDRTIAMLRWEFNFLLGAVVVSFAVFLCAIGILGLIYSHRIAGVVYKLRKAMLELAEGVPVQIQFRNHDEFQDLGTAFNSLSKKYGKKVRPVKSPRKKAS